MYLNNSFVGVDSTQGSNHDRCRSVTSYDHSLWFVDYMLNWYGYCTSVNDNPIKKKLLQHCKGMWVGVVKNPLWRKNWLVFALLGSPHSWGCIQAGSLNYAAADVSSNFQATAKTAILFIQPQYNVTTLSSGTKSQILITCLFSLSLY